jgi:predicted unusual protein kinase regulating ubiquinone biosynthesis (AarF/ABC1/UbiB family)
MSDAGPIIAHYRWVELNQKYFPVTPEESEVQYWKLHEKYASKVMESLRDLRGFYIKVAQVCANRPDILPEIYITKLRILEDQVPHLLNGEQAREHICKSLNLAKIEDAFKSFEDVPIGSASIGQVHKATLRDGSTVAVKVQSLGKPNPNPRC